jgi:phosphoribosylformimino-5-aminoimidazole carboxamide ribonucleotide (ProFAR) isomerase
MVGFDILPAVDIRGGRLARMRRGDPRTLAESEGDPFEVARRLVAAGARWIHVVDLDAAMTGEPANLDLIMRIADMPVQVQAGGGLRAEAVADALERGAARAVLGAGGLADRNGAERSFAEHPGRVAAGLDIRGTRLSPRGGASPEEPLEPVLDWLAELDAKPVMVVVTDVERDGTLLGPDTELLVRVARRVGVPVLASGGVRSLQDLGALRALGSFVAGAVVGRALSDGLFTLEEALAVAAP